MGTLIALGTILVAIIGFFMYAKRQGKAEAEGKQARDSYIAERKRADIDARAAVDSESVASGVSDYLRD
jgi:hypothetical protein